METAVRVGGIGHAVGSEVISNSALARSLGLKDDWFSERTGIIERRVCAAGEDVVALAAQAICSACKDADVDISQISSETVLLHIQNGMTCFTPPSGVVLASHLGLDTARVVAIDGVCAEPIAAIEFAVLMLAAGRCERVIVSAAADFLNIIAPDDPATAGLFGAGAGALILTSQRTAESALIRSLQWQTHAAYSDLGRIPILGYKPTSRGVEVTVGYYEMNGQGLARAALRILPGVVAAVLAEAGWTRDDIGLVVAHQPNAKLLEMGVRAMGIDPAKVPMPVKYLGNMGPASLLVNLSIARDEGMVPRGCKVLMVAFGLGFSCGAAAIEL